MEYHEWTLILPDYWRNFYRLMGQITKILDEAQ